MGTWLLVVAVPLHVFDLTGSTAATGAAFIAETLPALAIGPAAGVVVDRLDRRRLMIAVDLVRAAAVLSMLAVRSPGDLWIIYAALLVENGAAQLFRPARQALIPALIRSDDRLTAANAMFSVIDGLVRLIGSVAGGLLYVAIGFGGLVIADATSYLISAAGCLLVRYRPCRAGPGTAVTPADALGEFRAGLAHIRASAPLRGLLLVTGAFYLGNGALTALLVPYAHNQLKADSTRFGYLLAALGIGYLVGTPLSRLVIERFSTRLAVVVSIPVLAACFVLAFEPQQYDVTLVAFALAGAPAVVLLVAVQTDCQRRTGDALLGRVAATFLTVEMAASVAGAAAASTVAQQIGVMPVIGAAVIVLAVLSALTPRLIPAGPPALGTAPAVTAAPAVAAPAPMALPLVTPLVAPNST